MDELTKLRRRVAELELREEQLKQAEASLEHEDLNDLTRKFLASMVILHREFLADDDKKEAS